MKITYKIYVFLFFCSLSCFAGSNWVDFDVSMKLTSTHLTTLFNREHINLFRNIYTNNNLAKIKPGSSVKIPKIIHQIWLGSPFPAKYKKFQESWKKFHPDWQYKLWCDKDVEKFDPLTVKLVRGASNYGEASDILRYAILYKHGGLYVDTDFECVKSFDILHNTYTFYAGLEPLDTDALQINNALIASLPANPIFKIALKKIAKSREPRTVLKTGPLFFTQLFIENNDKIPGIFCIFPATFFYPCGFTQTKLDRSYWIKPESFAIHHWAASWIKK